MSTARRLQLLPARTSFCLTVHFWVHSHVALPHCLFAISACRVLPPPFSVLAMELTSCTIYRCVEYCALRAGFTAVSDLEEGPFTRYDPCHLTTTSFARWGFRLRFRTTGPIATRLRYAFARAPLRTFTAARVAALPILRSFCTSPHTASGIPRCALRASRAVALLPPLLRQHALACLLLQV